MQTKEYEIIRLLTRKNRILVMINSVLCTSCIILLLLISCRTAETEPYIHYTVQSGDTISSISKLSGVPADRIRLANELKSDLIKTGEVLKLPGISKLPKGDLLQQLAVITRNEWGAREAGSCDKATTFKKITVHHTTDNAKFKKTDIEFLRLVQKHHQKINGWADIGYHFLIGQTGNIFEGRSLKNMGAHVRGKNSGNIGIALLGDYENKELNPAQIATLQKLLDALRERYDIPRRMVFGHGELGDTKCPGKNTLTFLKNYRR